MTMHYSSTQELAQHSDKRPALYYLKITQPFTGMLLALTNTLSFFFFFIFLFLFAKEKLC